MGNFENICEKTIDRSARIGYNIGTVREDGAAKPAEGKRLKNFRKPLDKGEARWYNIEASLRGDPGERASRTGGRKKFEKLSKTP